MNPAQKCRQKKERRIRARHQRLLRNDHDMVRVFQRPVEVI